eukprot:gene1585-2221_t
MLEEELEAVGEAARHSLEAVVQAIENLEKGMTLIANEKAVAEDDGERGLVFAAQADIFLTDGNEKRQKLTDQAKEATSAFEQLADYIGEKSRTPEDVFGVLWEFARTYDEALVRVRRG